MNMHKATANQAGFVLPIGMVMLMLLSIIGITTLRDGVLQEKMSGNFIDQQKSFQAAESALRVIQRTTLHTSVDNITATANFHSTSDDPLNAPDYSDPGFDLNSVGFQVTDVPITTDNKIYAHPSAMIEELFNTESLKTGKAPANKELAKRFYRITVQAAGETATARTTLQGVVSR